MPTWRTLFEEVRARALPAGLDLAQPLQAGWYNVAVPSPYRLPDVGRPRSLAVLLGNTRVLWPRFLAALRDEPARIEAAHPLEDYVRDAVGRVVAGLPVAHEVRFAHDAPPRRVAIQRLAHVSGLAWLSPAHLCVHPVYGPWIALRAVVVLDAEGPPGPAPETPRPCHACPHACEPALAHAVSLADPGQPGVLEAHWRAWLAVRDACPVGHTWRYQEEHLVYGYTKDRELLRRLTRRDAGQEPP